MSQQPKKQLLCLHAPGGPWDFEVWHAVGIDPKGDAIAPAVAVLGTDSLTLAVAVANRRLIDSCLRHGPGLLMVWDKLGQCLFRTERIDNPKHAQATAQGVN